MTVTPVNNDNIITYVGAPSARAEQPSENTQLIAKEWLGTAFDLCFGTTPGMLVYRAPSQGDQVRSDWVALTPSSTANQVLTNGLNGIPKWAGGVLNPLTNEAVTVTGTNTFADLQHEWDGNIFMLFINGSGEFLVQSSPVFAVAGSSIIWLSGTLTVTPADTVVAVYTYVSAPASYPPWYNVSNMTIPWINNLGNEILWSSNGV